MSNDDLPYFYERRAQPGRAHIAVGEMFRPGLLSGRSDQHIGLALGALWGLSLTALFTVCLVA